MNFAAEFAAAHRTAPALPSSIPGIRVTSPSEARPEKNTFQLYTRPHLPEPPVCAHSSPAHIGLRSPKPQLPSCRLSSDHTSNFFLSKARMQITFLKPMSFVQQQVTPGASFSIQILPHQPRFRTATSKCDPGLYLDGTRVHAVLAWCAYLSVRSSYDPLDIERHGNQ